MSSLPNLCFTVTCFGHHIWPPASSFYELTERIHKRTAPHVLNKMESVMPELSVSNTYYPGIQLFILFRVSCCTVKRVYSICNFIRNALTGRNASQYSTNWNRSAQPGFRCTQLWHAGNLKLKSQTEEHVCTIICIFSHFAREQVNGFGVLFRLSNGKS